MAQSKSKKMRSAARTAKRIAANPNLEQELPGNLQLTRRSYIAHRKPCRGDLPEARRRRRRNPIRLPKAGMVRHIEHIAAQLERQPLCDLRVLLERQIQIGEARSKQLIARHI